MIDVSLNFDAVTSYFTSWEYAKADTYIIGPELDDMISWREWWSVADDTYSFRSAANCHKCYSDDEYGDNAAYYMSSYYFCFSTTMEPQCSDDGTELMPGGCAYCDDGTGHNDDDMARIWTKCTSLRFDADTKPSTDHYDCVTHSLAFRPSAVTNRDACTCYKPANKKTETTYTVPVSQLPPVTIPDDLADDIIIDPMIVFASDEQEEYDTNFDELPIVYLSQSDFNEGTYRIQTRGEYVLTENIVLTFNAPSEDAEADPDFSANSYDVDDLYWYPRHDQEDKYPGLYTYHGKFTLGFFAGISIECDDVIVDLNGFSIAMDYKFYFQQRFFSLIELGNQPFIGGQGPANWGSDQVFASNVIIKDGILALTSHHSIHGNHNNNVLISNVRMTQFDVAGFGCNACTQITVTDSIVGPQNTNIPVLGRYTHARTFLPRIKDLVENYGDQYMTFADREPILVQDLADRMVTEMDMIYNHFVNGVQYDEDDESWQSAKRIFYNPTGWMDGGSSYGLVFNGDGAAVIGIGCRTDGTSDITVNNVEIYGIYTQPIEKPKFQSDGAIRLSFFDGLDWPAVAEGLEDPYSARYIGDSYTDLVFAVNHFVDSWYYLNSLRITPAMAAFAEEGDSQAFGDEYDGVCGSDIQLHSSKGAIGLRIDGTQNINLNNIYVHDVQNWGALGIDICGEYHYPTVSHEDPQIQYGYTGNRAQGIIASYASGSMTDITIENIESYYGSAWGMVLYKGNEFGLSNINVKSVYAGTQLTAQQAQALTLPNIMPLACSVELRDEAVVTSLSGFDDFADVVGNDIIGHKLCDNPTNNYGTVLGVCEDPSCRMYDGDTMDGSNPAGPNAGTSTGGDRIETAPVAVDPPSDPLVYDAESDDIQFEDVEVPEGSVGIRSACNGLEDGVQYILPYGTFNEETAPLLPVVCNDGNTILDASLSFERYSHYFSSLYMYDVGIAGPELDDFSTWREWYLPLEDSANFIYGVSDDCSSQCLSDAKGQFDTTYYMTGNFYLCAWITKGDCDMDAESYECYQCARNGGRSTSVYPGVCSHVAMSADFEVHDDHFQCTGNNDNLKPSVGLAHQFCVCYNPTNSGLHESYVMDEAVYNAEIEKISAEMDATAEEEETRSRTVMDDGSNNIVYLSNADFLHGTYRITDPGIYILSENIELNFNAPTDEQRQDEAFSPNSYEYFYWLPRSDGTQDDEYMGASTWNGPYQLGFFTAVTVETSNVVIDLNGFEIGMSDEFYLQQRFFSIFELAAKNFVAGQGPVDFGPFLNPATNVVIKNGVIGKATHHGIHANDAKHVTLENLQIHSFDVAGIQLNGFDDITIRDCDIGPSSSNIPVTGRYLHARTLLRRFEHLVDNYGDEELAFSGRESQTVRDYVDELILQMDMVYNHVINGYEYSAEQDGDEDYQRWLKASDLFMNPNENGYGDGGVVYGILLNSRGGAVMGFGNAPSQSTNAVIENVNIHDLAISPLEKLKFKTNPLGGATRGPVADVFDIMKVADQWEDISTAKYVGSAYSDVQIAMSRFEKSWFVLDHTCFDEGIVSWALDGTNFDQTYYGGCNTDIQLHINKGVIGLRIDNIIGFTVNNVQISNLLNTGVLGTETDVCGAYTQGNAHQDPLITAGYTGTEGYGITITQSVEGSLSNVNIDNLQTYYGFATGVALFKDSSVAFDENIAVSNIYAGTQMQMEYLRPEQSYLPNKIPMACSVFDNNYNTQYTLTQSDDTIAASNINGYLLCSGDAMIGACDQETCVALYDQEYFDQLAASYQSIDDQLLDNKNGNVIVSGNTHGSLHRFTFIASFAVILSIIAFIMCYAWLCSPYTRIEKVDLFAMAKANVFASESTPLLEQ
eukprot:CAMPEP_0197030868 /NCGR_PEP_ID=MMETSP1384-20130603/10007_1 /TAXON_ID=29189 /ORGANISM="Ammonia sp." /LENGTH=1847 /DNA_ID=CAMNT_0042460297 /DNA_START=328 /DNA_END=5871 /DNA_ORIENTATION=-